MPQSKIYSSPKVRLGSLSLTLLMALLLFWLLHWWKLITPDPPFPESSSGGGQELALGIADLGNDVVDFSNIGSPTDVVQATEPSKTETLLEDPDGIEISKEQKSSSNVPPNKATKPIVIVPQPPTTEPTKPLSEAERLLQQSKLAKERRGGGIGNHTESGNSGAADGNPFAHGSGGSGDGNGGGSGSESGPNFGKGKNGTGYSIELKGRSVLVAPKLPSDLKEEGKVVVEITVDRDGNVIEANPNGRGTNTESAALKAKAKLAALKTRFNVEGRYEEQRGTLTFVFSFD